MLGFVWWSESRFLPVSRFWECVFYDCIQNCILDLSEESGTIWVISHTLFHFVPVNLGQFFVYTVVIGAVNTEHPPLCKSEDQPRILSPLLA